MHHIENIKKAAKTLRELGYKVVIPNPREGEVDYNQLSPKEQSNLKEGLIKEHFDSISSSDAVFIYNDEKKGIPGYIGGSTLMEMAFAYAQNLEIFLLHPTPHLNFNDEVEGMKPIGLKGDVTAINSYFKALPTTFVSSKSPIKLRAVSRGMRRAGIRTTVLPYPTASSVAEQPQSVEETYTGARNRHAALKEAAKEKSPAYFATVESGTHLMHSDHNVFETTVVILEKAGEPYKSTINLGVEYPKEMTDKVPSIYPDLGTLVQKEYGSVLKDPFPLFTGGKITRLQLVETAVFEVAVRLGTK